MAHFAEVNQENVVTRVIVIDNTVIGEPGLVFPDTEAHGQRFIANELRLPGLWLQTSYNGNFRGKYAGIGDIWDGTNFVTPVEES